MQRGFSLFDGRKSRGKRSGLLLFLFIISALIIGGISGCDCGGDEDVEGTDAIIVDGGTEDIVDLTDAISDVR